MPTKEFWFDSASRALEKSTEECKSRISGRLKTMAKYPDETVSAEIELLRGYIGNVLIESQPENGRKHKSEGDMRQEAIETDMSDDFLKNHHFPNLSPDLVSLYYFIARRQDGALSPEEIEIVESVRGLLSGEKPSHDDYEIPTESSQGVREFMSHLKKCTDEESNSYEAYYDAYNTIIQGFADGIIDEAAYTYSFRALAILGPRANDDPQCLHGKIDFLLSYFNAFLPTLNIQNVTDLLRSLVEISYENENRTRLVSLLLDHAESGVFLMQWAEFGNAVSLLRNCSVLGMTEHSIIPSLVEQIHECLVLIRSLPKATVEKTLRNSAFDMLHKVMILHPDLFDSDDVKFVRGKALGMERPSTPTPSVDNADKLIREILDSACTVIPYLIDHELGLEFDIFIAYRNAQRKDISLDVEMDGQQHDFSKLEDDFKDRIRIKRGINVVRIKNNEINDRETLRQKLTGIFKAMGLPVRE